MNAASCIQTKKQELRVISHQQCCKLLRILHFTEFRTNNIVSKPMCSAHSNCYNYWPSVIIQGIVADNNLDKLEHTHTMFIVITSLNFLGIYLATYQH